MGLRVEQRRFFGAHFRKVNFLELADLSVPQLALRTARISAPQW